MKLHQLMILAVALLVIAGASKSEAAPPKKVHISACLPNPKGTDRGNEWVEISNGTSSEVDLEGWILADTRSKDKLTGKLAAGKTMRFKVSKVTLNQAGDTLILTDKAGREVDKAVYTKAQVKEDKVISFVEK